MGVHLAASDELTDFHYGFVRSVRWDVFPGDLVVDSDMVLSERNHEGLSRVCIRFIGLACFSMNLDEECNPNGLFVRAISGFSNATQESGLKRYTYYLTYSLPQNSSSSGDMPSKNLVRAGALSVTAQNVAIAISDDVTKKKEPAVGLETREALGSFEEMTQILDGLID